MVGCLGRIIFYWTNLKLTGACFCHVPSNGQQCQCGGPRKEHQSVALGDYFSTAMVTHWNSAQHSSESATDAFGEVEFDGASKRHSCVSEHRVGYCIS